MPFKTPSNLIGVVATNTWNLLAELIITMVLLYFLLIYDDFFLRKIVHWTVGLDKKKEVVLITRKVQEKVFKYLFAKTSINFVLALVVSLLMFILGMPNPILWGVIAGILEFIPYFGALVSLIIITIVAIFSFASIDYAFLVAFLFLVVVFIEGNIITPIIIGKTMMLNPIIVFLSLLFWNWLWGIAGVFIAIPMMVTIKIVFDALYDISLVSELLSD
jgi:predicted PurR-regulated permease PerM